jgi:hypothetical protein
MNEFIIAEELKKEFSVFGSFYNIKTNSSDFIECRNNLEIFKKEYFTDLGDTHNQCDEIPDALAIMMNPGSSRPNKKLKDYIEPTFKKNDLADEIFSNLMVIAKPDTTQYQIMRVMQNQNWKHVRVLNLSDIRESKCNVFFKKVRDFEEQHGQIHSVFFKKRKKEQKRALSIKENSSIIVAWGCHRSLVNLADRAMACLNNKKLVGIQYDKNNLFRHPLPSLHKLKIEWLEEITRRLN